MGVRERVGRENRDKEGVRRESRSWEREWVRREVEGEEGDRGGMEEDERGNRNRR